MSEGLVDPEMIPRIDTSCVAGAAEDLRAMGGSVAENTDGMASAWAGLRAEGVYEAPEAETVYGLLDPAVAAAGEVESALGGAADALDVFAGKLEEIRPRLEELRAEAAEFRARALGGVDEPASKSPVYVPSYGAGSFRSAEGKTEHKQWWESAVLCEQNSKLFARINEQIIQIINAENDCVNALHDLIPDQCFMRLPTDLTGDVLDQLGDLPWGHPTEYQSRNCVESAVLGLGDAVKDMAAGAGSMIAGYDPRTGEFGNWESAGQTWSQLGNLGLSLAVALSPSTMMVDASRVFGADNQATRLAGDSRHTLGETLAGLVGIDPAADDPFAAWKKDGVRSAVSSLVNIGTFFIPGAEVGGAMKGAGLAGKAGRMALRGVGAFADTVIPGGSFAVKAAEAGARAADVAAHATEGAGLASRAARAIENGALHNPSPPDPGRAGTPLPADTGAGTTRHGPDRPQHPAGAPDMPDSARADTPDLGEGAARHGSPADARETAETGVTRHTSTDRAAPETRSPDMTTGGHGEDPGTGSRTHRDGEVPARRGDSDPSTSDARTDTTAHEGPGRSGEDPQNAPEASPRHTEGGDRASAGDAGETGARRRAPVDRGGPETQSPGAGPDGSRGRGDGDGTSGRAHGDGEVPARHGEPDAAAGDSRAGEGGGRHGDRGEGDARTDAAAHEGPARDHASSSHEVDARGRDADGSGPREDAASGHDETRPETTDEPAQRLADEAGKDRPGWDNKTDWPDPPEARMSDGTVEVTHDSGQVVSKSSDGRVTVSDGDTVIHSSQEGLRVRHGDGEFTINERGELTGAPEGTTVRRGEDGSWSIEGGGSDPVRIIRGSDGMVTVQHGDTTVSRLDGTTIADAGDGLYTKVHSDGVTHITQVGPDGCSTTRFEDGSFLHQYPDGGFETYGDPRLGGGRDFEGTVDPSAGLSDSGLTRNGKLDDPTNVPPEIQELVDKGEVSIDDKGVVRTNQKVTEDFAMRETAESYRQAGLQEHGMNDLTQDTRVDNIRERTMDKNWGDSEKAQYRRESERSLADSLEQQGVPADQARSQAKDMLSHHEALHGPDRVIGGNPDNFTGFGTETVPGNTANSEMGRHWSKDKTVDNFNRRMEDAVSDIPEELRGDVRVNTEFLVNGKTTNFTGLP